MASWFAFLPERNHSLETFVDKSPGGISTDGSGGCSSPGNKSLWLWTNLSEFHRDGTCFESKFFFFICFFSQLRKKFILNIYYFLCLQWTDGERTLLEDLPVRTSTRKRCSSYHPWTTRMLCGRSCGEFEPATVLQEWWISSLHRRSSTVCYIFIIVEFWCEIYVFSVLNHFN